MKNIRPRKHDDWAAERFKLLGEAVERTKNHVGADYVMVIACFKNGSSMEILDGGTTPVPVIQLYSSMVDAHLQQLENDPDYTGVHH